MNMLLTLNSFEKANTESIEELYLAEQLKQFLDDERVEYNATQFNELYSAVRDFMLDCNYGIDFLIAAMRNIAADIDYLFDIEYTLENIQEYLCDCENFMDDHF